MVSISTIFFSHFLGPGYWENCESIYWGGWDTCPVLIWRALQCWCQCNLIICCGTFDLWRKHNDNCLHPEQEGQTPLEWTYNFQNKMTTYKAVTFLWIHTRWGSFLSVCFWVDVFFLVLARRHLQHTSFSWCATAICDYSSPILIGRKNGLVCNNKSFFLFYLLRLRQLTLIFFI